MDVPSTDERVAMSRAHEGEPASELELLSEFHAALRSLYRLLMELAGEPLGCFERARLLIEWRRLNDAITRGRSGGLDRIDFDRAADHEYSKIPHELLSASQDLFEDRIPGLKLQMPSETDIC